MHGDYVGQCKSRKFDLCFLGDSITQMWPGDHFARNFGKFNPVNFGIGGDRAENVLWRLENGELQGTAQKVTVLLIGTNNQGMNTAEEMAVGVTAVVGKLQANCPQTKILLLGIFPAATTPPEKTKTAVATFVHQYNHHWCLEKLRYQSPIQARLAFPSAMPLAA